MTQFERPQFSRIRNLLLDQLPESDLASLSERGERVTIPLKTIVAEAGEPTGYAYFPLTNVLSSIISLQDGSMVEAATVGNEGMTGIELLTDYSASIYRVIQQIEGESLRVPADSFRQMLADGGSLDGIIHRYALTVMHQSSQNAACNVRHNVEERMCRWLLMTHDRVRKDEFYLTQEFLGIMLGVRRQSVSLTAATLQEAGLITYNRGNMTILDRPGLERTSCDCYQALQETYRQVMNLPTG